MNKVILQKDAPVLRAIAKEVEVASITSRRIVTIIKEMKKALASQDDGVAIAAPQIGYSLRIFVVSPKVKAYAQNKEETEESAKADFDVYINPEITKVSKQKKVMEEGCLSVRYLYGKVKRSEKVSIRAYNEEGQVITRGASGLLAQIFQHEIDHLNGILFIDKAKHIESMPPEYTS